MKKEQTEQFTHYFNTRDSMNRITIERSLISLEGNNSPFKELLSHGSLSVEIYKPIEVDQQQPHSRDELYVIAEGSGYFVKG